MAEIRKLKNILIRLRGRLEKSGITNRSKWTSFSSNTEMSPTQFARRLNNLGISITNKESVALWKMMSIQSNSLKFDDFVKLLEGKLPDTPLQSSETEPKPDSTTQKDTKLPTANSILLSTLSNNRKALLLKLSECDPLISGRISNTDFQTICAWFDVGDSGESIIKTYDKNGSGAFNYFSFLADLCEQTVPVPSIPVAAPKIESPTPSPPQQQQQQREKSPPKPPPKPRVTVIEKPVAQTPRTPSPKKRVNKSGIDDDLLRLATYGDSDDEMTGDAPKTRQSLNPELFKRERPVLSMNGSRGNLDATIFPTLQKTGGGMSPTGGRGKLDPMIFGARPASKGSFTEQKKPTADEIIGTKRLDDVLPEELMEIMSHHILKTARGNKECYQRWRGSHELLDTDDLRDGLARDLKILVPFEVLDVIVRSYGGPMTLSTFVRMLSDGSQMSERVEAPDATEDDAALTKISEHVHGTGWEEIVFNSGSVEDIVFGFAELGIDVSPDDVRVLTSKLGRTGFVSGIRARMSS